MELAKAPAPNVWNARMEQRAARATSSSTSSSSSSPPTSIPPSLSTRQSSATPAVKVQASAKPTSTNVPPMTDKDSWPDVTASLAKDANGGKDKEGDKAKEQRTKKAEKTKKWVPIPAQELQAAADAHKATTSNRGHSSSKGDYSRDKSSTRKNPPGSQQGSNRGAHRNDHPNSGVNSQAASASHSRVQSRSGSVHSSPRGAGRRRLPEDRRDRDASSNTASPRVNGVRSLGPSDEGRDRTLKPSTPSARSSKPSSPHPTVDFQSYPNSSSLPPNQFLPTPPHLPVHGLPPPHLYPPYQLHPHSAPYGGVYPPPPGAPYGLSPLAGHPLLPPSPGSPYADRSGDSEEKANSAAYSSMPHYSAPPHSVPLSYASNSYNLSAHYSSSTADSKSVQSQTTIGSANEQINGRENTAATSKEPVQFGSIDLSTLKVPADGSLSSSHASSIVNGVSGPTTTLVNGTGAASGRVLAIGVSPAELPGSGRAAKASSLSASTATQNKTGRRSRRPSLAVPVTGEDQDAAGDGKAKWEFGTTAVTASSSSAEDAAAAGSRLGVVAEDQGALARLSPLSMSLSASPNVQPPVGLAPISGSSALNTSNLPGLPHPPPGLSLPEGEGRNRRDDIPPGANETRPQRPPPSSSGSADEDFEVRDFGYGFGPASGTGRAVELAREEMVRRERERERELGARQQMLQAQQTQTQGPPMPIPLPHQQHQAPNRDVRHRDGDRERGSRGGPRGRGGRGGGSGGPPNRNMRRGNAPPSGPHNLPHNQNPHFNPNVPPHHMQFMAPSLHLPLQTPPGVFPHDGMPSPTAYFGGMRPGYPGIPPGPPLPPSGTVSFLPPPPPLPPNLLPHPPPAISGLPSAVSPTTSANPAEPPVPMPMTAIRFPLDPTRYYLLGQLEYYLSPQNMAMDFFLRKQMDSRGWIPISLIASFNRVRRLTPEINLVRDVLFLSSMVQVRDDHVRMGGWERFVLPDAAESNVPEEHPMMPMEMPLGAAPADGVFLFNNRGPLNAVEEGGAAPFGYGQMPAPQHYRPEGGPHISAPVYGQGVQGGDHGVGEDEDEEDDVEFVMGTNGHSG